MTAPSSPDPARPQWTWTDEAREAVLRSAWNVNPGEAWDEDWVSAEAVLDALAPHVARQVAEAESLAADTYARLLDMTAERDALQRQVDAMKAALEDGVTP